MFESLIYRTLWSNHGPRIVPERNLIRFWEPPASRVFLQLRVNRVLSLQLHSESEGVSFSRKRVSCVIALARFRTSNIWIVGQTFSRGNRGFAPISVSCSILPAEPAYTWHTNCFGNERRSAPVADRQSVVVLFSSRHCRRRILAHSWHTILFVDMVSRSN